MSWIKKYFGPSTLVTAAFIGPGTLTVCTLSGTTNGYSLLWVLLFATIATILLQEMAARLGLISQKGLGEAIREELKQPMARTGGVLLVFVSIVIGNAAYEAGNISGAVLGLEGAFGSLSIWPLTIGGIAFAILYIGKFKVIEKILVALVLIMSAIFLLTAIVVKPDFSLILDGLIPRIDASNQLAILALIGTTIVPYNLFLHASSVSSKWKKREELKDLRIENIVAIALGGLISMAIVITSAATIQGRGVTGINDMALQLAPLLGGWSKWFLAIGLFAAGISSSITAPLAAAYAAKGIFGWDDTLNSWKMRAIWISILLVGVLFSMIGYRPIEVIKVAQVANGILLPVVAVFLIYICNKQKLLGPYVNKPWQNILGAFVLLISVIISLRSLNSVFQFL